jgi:hypothetical protein
MYKVELIVSIRNFLAETLRLELHPKKVIIKKLSQGIDFVGYVLFERHVLLRARTKRRMKRRLKGNYSPLPSLRRRSGTHAGTGAGTKEKKIA